MVPPLAMLNVQSSVAILRDDLAGRLALAAAPAISEAPVAPAPLAPPGDGRGRRLDVLA